MLTEQLPIECIGVVKVNVLTLLDRHITAVFVIRILRDNYHLVFREALYEFPDYRCFTRAGSARYADDEHKSIDD